MAKYWGTPPFFAQIFLCQIDSEWLEMDFKHNFSQCNILTRDLIGMSAKKFSLGFWISKVSYYLITT